MQCKLVVASWLAASLAWPAPGLAQDSGNPLLACRREADDATRLACYDREVDRLGESGVGPAAVQPEPKLSPEERFGRRGEMTREETDRKVQETRDLDELNSKVTEIWTRSDGLMVIALENGQVWRQNAPDAFFRLKVGDMAKIQPGVMKSFILSGPSKRSTRVTRTE